MKNNIRIIIFSSFLMMFSIALFAQNNAPVVVNSLQDFSINEDSSDFSINLNEVFADQDNDVLAFSVSGNNHLQVEINNGLVIIIPQQNWNGTETLTFTATDPLGESASDNVTITVTGINDLPFVDVTVSSVSITFNTPYTSINLNTIFSDPDLIYGDVLSYSYSGNVNIGVSVVAGVVTFTPDFDFWGTETISFTATDLQGASVSQDVSVSVITPEIANVSVSPNPFSPDNDGQKDQTTISFYTSANGTADLVIFERDIFPRVPVLIENIPVNAGWNQFTWDGYANTGVHSGSIVPDAGYGMSISVGSAEYEIEFSIYVDTTPPIIDLLSSYPNPFSPNGDGYNDFHDVRYRVDDVRIEYIGLVHVNLWMQGHDPYELMGNYPYMATKFINEDGSDADYSTLNAAFNVLTDGGYLLIVRDLVGPTQVNTATYPQYSLSPNAEYDFIVGGNGSQVYNRVEVTTGESIYKIGALQYPYLSVNGVGSNDHETDTDEIVGHDFFRVFVVEGNASFNIYNSNGSVYALNDLFPIYYGDFQNLRHPITNDLYSPGFQYRATIPGIVEVPDEVMPDGRYIYRIIVTDQAGHAEEESGELLVNNYPIEVTATVNPISISPGNADGYYDHTVIQYQVSERAFVTVKIWDTNTNQVVKILRDGLDTPQHGYVIWDGTDHNGNPVSLGEQTEYIVEITAQDKEILEDVVSEHITVTVDNIGPAAANIYLLNGEVFVTTPTITVAGISNDVTSDILLYVNGIYQGVVGTTPQYPGYFEFPVALQEGMNTIMIRLRDSAWNMGEYSNIISLTLDSSAPFINITNPEAEQLFRHTPIRLQANVSDLGGVGVSPSSVKFGVSYYGNTIRWENAQQSVMNSNVYYYDLHIDETIEQLAISLYAQAADMLGNTTVTEESVEFFYRAILPPDIISHIPADGEAVNALPNGRLSVITYDNEGLGLNQSDSNIWLQTATGAPVTGTKTIVDLGENQYRIDFVPSTNLSNGQYTFISSVKDNFEDGGSVATLTTNFIFDATSPVVSNLEANNVPNTQSVSLYNGALVNFDIASISMDFSDLPAGINNADSEIKLYRQNGVMVPGIKTITGDKISWVLTAPLLYSVDFGNYYVEYNIVDNATNASHNTVSFILSDAGSP
ncbi:MAG: Ig-like domain-containing protein, partial [Candidatus Cloacimonetes bacterium]|nr:Ig-like domain-containing protein [Candidatus Cloacimonadota bacterium]